MPYAAKGSVVFVSSATASSTGSSANVGCLTGFSGPDGQSNEIDITCLADSARQYVLGVSDEGSMSIDFLAQSSAPSQKNLVEAKQNGSQRACKLRLSDPATTQLDFMGYVKNVSLSAGGVDDAVTGNCVIRISGAVTWTTA